MKDIIDIYPLLDIDIFRFAITVKSKKTFNISDTYPVYRGKLGFSIKQNSCQFDDFQSKDCMD